ncbi:hypothetical protein M514_09790 [Trichuris suis]|uniref:Ubiquitin-like domain-containing protein n=1 Tax=Trichuris suis TaxID=68888 RepID=A0A085NMA2_9BILA|nr:hypothetical protein M513_09790 [Trichuris suis]KFD70598.1 hypothetical protein M514_09790 [Trichuris suis]
MGSYVELSVTTDEQEFNCVRRFPLSITVGELKKRVELLVGVPYNAMSLELRQQDDITRRNLLVDDSATLNMLSLTNGMILHVRDERGPNVLGEEIFSPADGTKFELSDEKYNQKTNTVRAWLKEQKLKCHQDYSADNESDRSEELASKLRVRYTSNQAFGLAFTMIIPSVKTTAQWMVTVILSVLPIMEVLSDLSSLAKKLRKSEHL